MTKTAPTHRLQPGDLICGNCGEGNTSSRKFCSRCGDSLVEAVIVEERWWHRFRPRRGPRTVKLGAEKGKAASGSSLHAPKMNLRQLASAIYRKARVVVALAVVAAGVIYGVFPPFRHEVNSVFTSEKRKIVGIIDQKFAPVHPIKCVASSQVSGHSGGLVCDGFFNNYWLAPFRVSPQPTITMTFAHPVTITRLILHNGAFGRYVQEGRPSSLHLVFSNGETFTITPQDTPQPQQFVVKHALLIKSIVFQVSSVYQGTAGTTVAISQIELFGIQ